MLRLNLTESLASTKTLFQVGRYYELEWGAVVDWFANWFNTNFNDVKDTNGFSFADMRKYTYNDWRIKLYTYMIQQEEVFHNHKLTPKKEKGILFKWNQVKTEQDRINLLNDLFKNDYDKTLHRVRKDIINKHVVIVDIDNKSNLIQYISPNEILDKAYKMGFNFIAYSSFNNTREKPKFRIIIPTDRPYTVIENLKLREYFAWFFTCREYNDFVYDLIDYTSFEAPRFFYIPVNRKDNNSRWFVSKVDGHEMSVDISLKKHSKLLFEKKILLWKNLKELRRGVE